MNRRAFFRLAVAACLGSVAQNHATPLPAAPPTGPSAEFVEQVRRMLRHRTPDPARWRVEAQLRNPLTDEYSLLLVDRFNAAVSRTYVIPFRVITQGG